MAGKKKKKLAANPARGFATVSIPSKPKDVAVDSEILSSVDSGLAAGSAATHLKDADADAVGSREPDIAKMTPEQLEAHLELEELSLLVEKNATAVKAQATRYATKLQNERRQMRVQADKAFISETMNDLFEDILRMQLSPGLKRSDSAHSPCVDEIEILLKLWVLQEVLTRLHMPSIHDALTYALSLRFHSQKNTVDQVSGLAEVFEWYAGHFTTEDLPEYDSSGKSTTVERVSSEDEEVSSNNLPGKGKTISATNAISIESLNDLPDEFNLSQSSDTDEDDDPSALVERWLQLQTLNFKIEQYRMNKDYELRKRKIDSRLAKIKHDPLFDSDEAVIRWDLIRRELDIQMAQDRKRSSGTAKSQLQQTAVTPVVDDNDDEDDDMEPESLLGDMFEGDQAIEGHETNAIIRIRDFGGSSGPSPRRFLEDIWSKGSQMKGLKFTRLQVNSYSARLELTLFWKQPTIVQEAVRSCIPQGIRLDVHSHRWSFAMESLATTNSLQAEAYLSTLALFILDSEGYNTNKASTLLSKSWKEIYTDLGEALQEIRRKEDVKNVSYLRELIRNESTGDKSIQSLPAAHNSVDTQRRVIPMMQSSPERLPPAEAIELWQSRASRPSYQKMQPTRTSLPVFAHKESILQTSGEHQIILVCADTGAGKSTQIPSYILEHSLKQGKDIRVLVTQPRRISAISIARRVSEEIGEDSEHLGTSRSLIGYAIRLESKMSVSTRLTFATTGVLLRMLQESFNLDQYDCLILDEVHERTMDLDLIFIALKQLQMRRSDLKIILMSATVETNKFSAYFDNCPVLQIPGRTFPVQVGYLEDAIEETSDLKEKSDDFEDTEEPSAGSDDDQDGSNNEFALNMAEYSASTLKSLKEHDHRRIDYQLILRLATAIATYPKYEQYSTAILIFMPGLAEIRRLSNMLMTAKTFSANWIIHMLHSSFSTRELEQAFLRPPPGVRKIVIATNIAETGITIPDVTAVIDTCKEKVMRFDERRQLSRLTEGVISRSSARQRRGRAARVQNGLCFHLVPKYHFDHKLPEQSTPEMLRLSLQQSLLRIKVWNLGSIEEVLSAAIDPPTVRNMNRAVSKLRDAGAIDSVERLTPLGKLLAKLPLDVALGKLAIYGVLFQNLDAAVTVIAITSVKSIFIDARTARDYSQTSFFSHDSDLMTTYKIYCAWKNACKAGFGQQFCRNQRLSHAQLLQVDEQKLQLLVYLTEAGIVLLDHQERSALNRARSSRKGIADFDVPVRYNRLNDEDVMAAVIAVAFYPRILRRDSGSTYRNVYTNQYLQVAAAPKEKVSGFKPPKWLCYMETIQVKGGKVNVLNSSRITEPLIVALLGDADFNLFTGVITIDNGNIRISLRQWREMLAFKRLREQFRRVINGFLADPGIVVSSDHIKWTDLVVKILQKG